MEQMPRAHTKLVVINPCNVTPQSAGESIRLEFRQRLRCTTVNDDGTVTLQIDGTKTTFTCPWKPLAPHVEDDRETIFQ